MRMFSECDVPRMDGTVVEITGANSGPGFKATLMLAGRGALIVLACRDQGRMALAVTSLRATGSGAMVDGLLLRLTSPRSMERASNELATSDQRVDVVVNDAGVYAVPKRTPADGFERHRGTNHLGHFAFTGRTLPSPDNATGKRVIPITSLFHRLRRIDFNAISRPSRYGCDCQ